MTKKSQSLTKSFTVTNFKGAEVKRADGFPVLLEDGFLQKMRERT